MGLTMNKTKTPFIREFNNHMYRFKAPKTMIVPWIKAWPFHQEFRRLHPDGVETILQKVYNES